MDVESWQGGPRRPEWRPKFKHQFCEPGQLFCGPGRKFHSQGTCLSQGGGLSQGHGGGLSQGGSLSAYDTEARPGGACAAPPTPPHTEHFLSILSPPLVYRARNPLLLLSFVASRRPPDPENFKKQTKPNQHFRLPSLPKSRKTKTNIFDLLASQNLEKQTQKTRCFW